MLHMFHTYVASVFIWMLLMFYNSFQVFLQVFQMHVSSVSSVFRRMLQVLCLNVSKVDGCCISLLAFCCLASVSPPLSVVWASATPSPLLDAGGVRDGAALHRHAKQGGKQTAGVSVRKPCSCGHPDASKPAHQIKNTFFL